MVLEPTTPLTAELKAAYTEDLKHYKTTEGQTRDEIGELPAGWKCRETHEGRLMYYNRGKNVTSWDRPSS